MDEYDVLLYEINREKKRREEKKFWKGKKWTEEQIRKMEMQDKARLEIGDPEGADEGTDGFIRYRRNGYKGRRCQKTY